MLIAWPSAPTARPWPRGTASRRVGGVVLWDTARRERLQEKPLAVTEGDVHSVAFSPDGKTLAAGYGARGRGGGVVLWDTARRERLQEKPLAVTEGYVTSERGLQPRRQDPGRGVQRQAAIRSAASGVWCSGTRRDASGSKKSPSP